MNIFAIALVIGTIALVVGPIMMMQPSQRDRRLTALRQAAAQKKMGIRLTDITLSSGTTSLAVYSLSLSIADMEDREPLHWSLVQQAFEHDVHFEGFWDWQDKRYQAPAKHHSLLREQVRALDDSVVGIELTPGSVGIYWTEQSISIDEVERILIACRDTFSGL